MIELYTGEQAEVAGDGQSSVPLHWTVLVWPRDGWSTRAWDERCAGRKDPRQKNARERRPFRIGRRGGCPRVVVVVVVVDDDDEVVVVIVDGVDGWEQRTRPLSPSRVCPLSLWLRGSRRCP